MNPLTIASLGVGALQSITGLLQKGKAAKMAASNPRPVYKKQQPILDNQALIEAKAGEGLDDATTQVYTTNARRGLTASIEAVLRGGGSVNNIAELENNYEGNVSRLTLLDSQMRVANVRQLIAQNREMAGEMDKEWQVNTYAPYADRAQAAGQLQQQGNNNLWKGINTGFNAVSSQLNGDMWRKEMERLYGAPSPVPAADQNMFTTQGANPNSPMRAPYVQSNVFGG